MYNRDEIVYIDGVIRPAQEPVGFCYKYDGCLSKSIVRAHNCANKNCQYLAMYRSHYTYWNSKITGGIPWEEFIKLNDEVNNSCSNIPGNDFTDEEPVFGEDTNCKEDLTDSSMFEFNNDEDTEDFSCNQDDTKDFHNFQNNLIFKILDNLESQSTGEGTKKYGAPNNKITDGSTEDIDLLRMINVLGEKATCNYLLSKIYLMLSKSGVPDLEDCITYLSYISQFINGDEM